MLSSYYRNAQSVECIEPMLADSVCKCMQMNLCACSFVFVFLRDDGLFVVHIRPSVVAILAVTSSPPYYAERARNHTRACRVVRISRQVSALVYLCKVCIHEHVLSIRAAHECHTNVCGNGKRTNFRNFTP